MADATGDLECRIDNCREEHRVSDYLNGGNHSRDHLQGGQGEDIFVRHKSVFGSDDNDRFFDFSTSHRDWVENIWHW